MAEIAVKALDEQEESSSDDDSEIESESHTLLTESPSSKSKKYDRGVVSMKLKSGLENLSCFKENRNGLLTIRSDHHRVTTDAPIVQVKNMPIHSFIILR